MGKQRRQYTAAFKFQVALEAARGTKTVSQIASEYGVHLFGANYTDAGGGALVAAGGLLGLGISGKLSVPPSFPLTPSPNSCYDGHRFPRLLRASDSVTPL